MMIPDLDAGWDFYSTLGLKPIVDSRPRYVRFTCPDGDSTFSLHQGDIAWGGSTDISSARIYQVNRLLRPV